MRVKPLLSLRHPFARALLSLAGKEGVGILNYSDGKKIRFYIGEGTVLHATGLVPLALLLGKPEASPPKDPKAEALLLADILTSRGWYEAFRLATLQVSLALQAVPRLEGKKRFAFAPFPIPEALKKIASSVRITPEALSLFFPENSEWEDPWDQTWP